MYISSMLKLAGDLSLPPTGNSSKGQGLIIGPMLISGTGRISIHFLSSMMSAGCSFLLPRPNAPIIRPRFPLETAWFLAERPKGYPKKPLRSTLTAVIPFPCQIRISAVSIWPWVPGLFFMSPCVRYSLFKPLYKQPSRPSGPR